MDLIILASVQVSNFSTTINSTTDLDESSSKDESETTIFSRLDDNPAAEEPPVPLIGDKLKISVLIFLCLIGFPLNATAGMKLSWTSERLKQRPTSRERMDMHCLKRHLNVADVLIVSVYAVSELVWTMTYKWNGGEWLCGSVMTARLFSVQVSSNIVVCIAVNRYLTVAFPFPSALLRMGPCCSIRRVHLMTGLAWILAALIALPQYAVWHVVTPFPNSKLDPTWTQCTPIWEIQRELSTAVIGQTNSPLSPHNRGGAEINKNYTFLAVTQEVYNSVHLGLVFWIPLLLIGTVYAGLVFKLQCYSTATSSIRMLQRRRANHSPGGADTRVSERGVLRGGGTGSNDSKSSSNRSNKETNASADTNSYYVTMRRLRAMSSQEGVRNARRRTIRASALIVAVYILCWLPYNSMELMKILSRPWYERHTQQIQVFNVLIVANSVVNPFLYGMFGQLYRMNPNK